MSNHCSFHVVDILLRKNGGGDMRPNYVIFVISSAPNADSGVVLGLGFVNLRQK